MGFLCVYIYADSSDAPGAAGNGGLPVLNISTASLNAVGTWSSVVVNAAVPLDPLTRYHLVLTTQLNPVVVQYFTAPGAPAVNTNYYGTYTGVGTWLYRAPAAPFVWATSPSPQTNLPSRLCTVLLAQGPPTACNSATAFYCAMANLGLRRNVTIGVGAGGYAAVGQPFTVPPGFLGSFKLTFYAWAARAAPAAGTYCVWLHTAAGGAPAAVLNSGAPVGCFDAAALPSVGAAAPGLVSASATADLTAGATYVFVVNASAPVVFFPIPAAAVAGPSYSLTPGAAAVALNASGWGAPVGGAAYLAAAVYFEAAGASVSCPFSLYSTLTDASLSLAAPGTLAVGGGAAVLSVAQPFYTPASFRPGLYLLTFYAYATLPAAGAAGGFALYLFTDNVFGTGPPGIVGVGGAPLAGGDTGFLPPAGSTPLFLNATGLVALSPGNRYSVTLSADNGVLLYDLPAGGLLGPNIGAVASAVSTGTTRYTAPTVNAAGSAWDAGGAASFLASSMCLSGNATVAAPAAASRSCGSVSLYNTLVDVSFNANNSIVVGAGAFAEGFSQPFHTGSLASGVYTISWSAWAMQTVFTSGTVSVYVYTDAAGAPGIAGYGGNPCASLATGTLPLPGSASPGLLWTSCSNIVLTANTRYHIVALTTQPFRLYHSAPSAMAGPSTGVVAAATGTGTTPHGRVGAVWSPDATKFVAASVCIEALLTLPPPPCTAITLVDTMLSLYLMSGSYPIPNGYAIGEAGSVNKVAFKFVTPAGLAQGFYNITFSMYAKLANANLGTMFWYTYDADPATATCDLGKPGNGGAPVTTSPLSSLLPVASPYLGVYSFSVALPLAPSTNYMFVLRTTAATAIYWYFLGPLTSSDVALPGTCGTQASYSQTPGVSMTSLVWVNWGLQPTERICAAPLSLLPTCAGAVLYNMAASLGYAPLASSVAVGVNGSAAYLTLAQPFYTSSGPIGIYVLSFAVWAVQASGAAGTYSVFLLTDNGAGAPGSVANGGLPVASGRYHSGSSMAASISASPVYAPSPGSTAWPGAWCKATSTSVARA